MITVHHLNNSRSLRVLWLLEKLDLQYTIQFYQREKTMAAPPELKRIHPLGKAPIIEEFNDEQNVVLIETGAICEYLIERANGRCGEPTRPVDARLYRQYMHYAEGSVMPVLFTTLVVSKIPLLGRIASRRIRPMLDAHLNFIDCELATRPWFAGIGFTAADVMMSFPLEAAKSRGLLDTSHPAILRWPTQFTRGRHISGPLRRAVHIPSPIENTALEGADLCQGKRPQFVTTSLLPHRAGHHIAQESAPL